MTVLETTEQNSALRLGFDKEYTVPYLQSKEPESAKQEILCEKARVREFRPAQHVLQIAGVQTKHFSTVHGRGCWMQVRTHPVSAV